VIENLGMDFGGGEARISAVGVLKGVLILQRKFAMVGESEPVAITNSGVCGSALTVVFHQVHR
jgi:hypothetical protein